jgi:hypothetical protein
MRQVFIRVYRLEIQSVMLVFSTHLCELLTLASSPWFNSLPPPPCVNNYTVFTMVSLTLALAWTTWRC